MAKYKVLVGLHAQKEKTGETNPDGSPILKQVVYGKDAAAGAVFESEHDMLKHGVDKFQLLDGVVAQDDKDRRIAELEAQLKARDNPDHVDDNDDEVDDLESHNIHQLKDIAVKEDIEIPKEVTTKSKIIDFIRNERKRMDESGE